MKISKRLKALMPMMTVLRMREEMRAMKEELLARQEVSFVSSYL